MTRLAALPGGAVATPANPTIVDAGTTRWMIRVETNFSTPSNVSFTPADLAFPLVAGNKYWIHVKGFAGEIGGTENVFEFDARNVWKRTGPGVSSRIGADIGAQTTVANQFPAPPATRPSVKFSDPFATNVGSVLFTGRLATPINWHVWAELIVGP